MTTMAAEKPGPASGSTRGLPVAWISAAGFAVAAVWFTLIETGITQSAAPDFPSASIEAAMMAHYAWFTTTLLQERAVTAIAIGAFAAMIVAVWRVRTRLGSGSSATAGALLVSLGAAVWIVGNVTQLGGHRAVGAMATNGNPLEIANAIAFTVDIIDDAFELAGFALLGLGMACLAGAAWQAVTTRTWSGYSAALSVVLLVLAAAHGMSDTNTADLLLVVIGGALVPAWLVWSQRLVAQSSGLRQSPERISQAAATRNAAATEIPAASRGGE